MVVHGLRFLIVLPVALLSVLLLYYVYSEFPDARSEVQQLFVLHFYFMEYQVKEVLWIVVRLLVHHLDYLVL